MIIDNLKKYDLIKIRSSFFVINEIEKVDYYFKIKYYFKATSKPNAILHFDDFDHLSKHNVDWIKFLSKEEKVIFIQKIKKQFPKFTFGEHDFIDVKTCIDLLKLKGYVISKPIE